MSPARHRALTIALLLLSAMWLATLAADRAPPARPLDAPATQFSGQRARVLLQALVGDNVPHPLGSPANAQLRERIVAALRALGLAPELQSGSTICTSYGVCGMPINILARIQGSEGESDRAVLLCAHYDSVAAGPGASDNGSGVAALLEIARILQQLPRPRQSIILLFDDGEEVDLLGAHAFVEHHRWAATVTAAVNLDARGTSGPSLMFETGSANRWLMSLYSRAVARPLTNSVYYEVYKLLPNDTDFTVFKAAGFQGFNFAFIGDVAHYHTALDDAAHADAGSMQQQGDNALSTLLALANAGAPPAPSGEAAYFDLFGRMLVRIPQAWLLPAALMTLLLTLIAGARLLQLRRLRWRTLAWGSAGVSGALLIGAAGAAALMAALRAIGTVSAGGAMAEVAYPWALECGFAALALFITAVSGTWLQRRAGLWGLLCSGTLLCALLAVALAGWLPGASYLALLPALAALLGLMPAMRSGHSSSAESAALVACLVCFVLVLPLALPLYGALGGDGLPLLTLLLIYSSSGLAALVAVAARHLQRMLIAATALFLGAALIVAALLPRYSTDSPQRLNLQYYLDAGTQQAQWIADPLAGALPAALLQAAAFTINAQSPAAGGVPAWVAAAPPLPLPAPQLSVLSSVPSGAQQHYRIHIASARAAPVIALAFAPEARVTALQLMVGATLAAPATPRRLRSGWSRLRLFGVPPQGLELSFDASASAFGLQLMDESYGLPPQGQSLQLARPATAVASQDGDVTRVTNPYRLQP
ncbi:MAG TPA: M28 family peptidase [Steroidobacteraceae bacterium]|nr:M28 family peptidase [Steroidobacteraceae bacterium]